MPATENVDVTIDPEAENRAADRIARLKVAEIEHAAVKAWKRDGEKGDKPATPTLDEMTQRFADAGCAPGSAGSTKRARKSTGVARADRPASVFIIDGKEQVWKRTYKLSNVAWNHTAKISDGPRIPLPELVKILHGLGVAQPELPGWDVTLPNGKRVECVAADVAAAAVAAHAVVPTPAAAPAAPKSDTKAPAKKASTKSPSKEVAAPKPAAKSTPAKSTAKSTQAKKAASKKVVSNLKASA